MTPKESPPPVKDPDGPGLWFTVMTLEAHALPVPGCMDYATLFRREYPVVLRDVVLIVGDPEAARDVVQEAFARLHVHWRKVSGYDRPGAWVRRVAIREAVKANRRRARDDAHARQAALDDSVPPASPDPDLYRAIARLPAMQRAAVVLRYLHDLPVRDVAEAIGCREATANVHLHRARRRLGEILGEEVGDDA